MKNSLKSERLTPAAQQALEAYLQEYEAQVINRAEQLSYSSGSTKITVSDIFRSISLVSVSDTPAENKSLLSRTLSVYRQIGILLIIFSLLFLIIYVFENTDFSRELLLGLSIGIFGGIINLVVSALKDNVSIRYHKVEDMAESNVGLDDGEGVYLLLWRDIEFAMRDLIARKLGESHAGISLSVMFTELEKAGLLTSQDLLQAKKLLTTRNKILHSEEQISLSELDDKIIDARKLLSKLVSR